MMSFIDLLTRSEASRICLAGVVLALCASHAQAAMVNAGTGYTNDFSAKPPAADWSTATLGSSVGAIASAANLDSAVQTNVAVRISAECGSATANPPNAANTAVWSSAGSYLQLRPTQNAATLLMATFINNTGADAIDVHLSYDYATNRAGLVAEEVRGLRVYYSLSGTGKSWVNIPELSQTSQGTLSVDLRLAETWANGATLYLLWADDNGSGSPDDANDIDNFNLRVSGGVSTIPPLIVSITDPPNGAVFQAPASIAMSATVSGQPDPTNIVIAATATDNSVTSVALYINGTRWGEPAAPPSTWTWTNASLGDHVLTTVALDSSGLAHTSAPVVIAVVTNIPPSVALTAPTTSATFTWPSAVTLSATASDDYGIAQVEFLSDGAKVGESAASPYSFTWTKPPLGAHVVTAMAMDIYGVTSPSLPSNIVVTLPPVTRGPYLNNRGPTSITVRWRTQSPTDSRVRYGLSPDNLLWTADDPAETTEHIVTVSGLTPETKYHYSIGTAIAPIVTDANFFFSTAPLPGASRPTRIWFLSDYGLLDSTQAAVRDAYLNFIGSDGHAADVWLTGGDNNQEQGSDAQFQSTMFPVYASLLRNTAFFPVNGNHDGGPSSAYWSIFSLPTKGEAGGWPSGTNSYYSFDHGDIHFVGLDAFAASRALDGPMLTWLRQDLANTTQRWIIAYWHQPPYTKVFYDSDTDTNCREMRENVVPILESYGVDLVLNGHCHSLQRTYLISQHYGPSATFSAAHKIDGGDGRVDGTGAYLKPGKAGTVYTAAPTGCAWVRDSTATHPACFLTLNNTAGSLVIDVNSNRLDLKCVTSTGAIGDYFTILKGASQSAPPATPANFAARTDGPAIVLTWDSNATNEVSYSLERSINGGPFAEVAVVGANLTSFTNLTANLGPEFVDAHYYRIRSSNNAGYSDYSAIASVSPAGPPAIDLHPRSLTALEGSTAVFQVLARGSGPMSYQWFRDNLPLPGQTNSMLKLVNVAANDAGRYSVVIANNQVPLSSDPAVLTVTSPAKPPILAQTPQWVKGVFTVGFQGTPGVTYTIQSTDSLDTPWQPRSTVTVPPSGLVLVEDMVSGVPQRFYRLVSAPQ